MSDHQDYAAVYQPMSDRELMDRGREIERMIEPAQAALRAEFVARGFRLPDPPKVAARSSAAEHYAHLSHRKLLRAAEIYAELPEASQAALRAEFASRGVDPPELEGNEELIEDHRLPDQLVTVARYRDMPEAIVARAVLEAAGIDCYLRDEYTVHMDWMMSNFIGGMRLQVGAQNEAAARQLLEQPMPSSFSIGEGEEFVQPVCPKCGSLEVVANDTDRKIKLGSTLLMGLPMIIGLPALAFQRDDVLKCLNCGCRWYYDAESEA